MKCPVDNETLVMSDRNGVEIDYCPKCRGVWLDRGELDKILERSAAPVVQPEPPREVRREPERRVEDRHHPHHDDDDRYRYGEARYPDYRKKKRKDFLSDLFDF
ncbi:TFIIB-type zinc ribbon-containing protein [Neotabrizicola shimadae]|uniref:Zf-TFIIB domain-containing protein n=1 Tax=Neotabrizicola shimadae TaxID=2807096 RepID=A0A8G0ZTX5_9RHOB|nr:zf-TFIIB domain-containing protein [Neotabrizicola shimadae]QYZ68618.1 zf-TFIIB domain-containing protein [Neotabrizicola shimadae]